MINIVSTDWEVNDMKQNSLEDVLRLAIEKARVSMNEDIGGPFGAAVINPNGKILALASNSVLSDHDPTAHAEVNAIRIAGHRLKTHNLKGCILVATAYPCPMCCSAIIWANISEVYYGATAQDAANTGFRDDFIYAYFKDPTIRQDVLNLHSLGRDACLSLFQEYHDKSKQLY
jgi:guanine deaminase